MIFQTYTLKNRKGFERNGLPEEWDAEYGKLIGNFYDFRGGGS